MAETLGDLNAMLNDFNRVYQQVCLRMKKSKTKIMSNAHVPLHPVIVGSFAVEIVDEYIYLGHTIQLGRSNFEKWGEPRNPTRRSILQKALSLLNLENTLSQVKIVLVDNVYTKGHEIELSGMSVLTNGAL
ncbi:jg6640 [Pararge aegeria aegeria]|uniref:Jg6640 protein n=1 Tax=Pararge aegeria aegeria TaxID=348720 RepID=A0A8S4QCN5_9NEOP|nr:jg6640 [Pararge aegeria aegeria]